MKIVLSVAVVTALILVGCSGESEKSQAVEAVKVEVVEEAPVVVAVEEVAEVAVAQIEEITEIVNEETNATTIVDEVVTVIADANDSVIAVIDDVTAVVSDASGEVVAVAKDAVAAVKDVNVDVDVDVVVAEAIAIVTPASSVDGKAAYSSCAGCHGTKGEKKALGKSKVITGWDAAKTADALNGYAAGTYGGAMKGIMKGQAAKLSADEITAVSDYISKF